MPTVLITGTSRGLGLEFARQYAAEGWRVLACCRKPAEAGALKAAEGDVDILPLDVTDEEAIARLAKRLDGEPIDVLINNAGVYGPRRSTSDYGRAKPWLETLHVNTVAPYQITHALLDNLRAGERKVVGTITSRMGSITDNDSGDAVVYRSSKAGVNAVMKSLALDLAEDGIMVLLLHPGWVRTDMGGSNALIDADESVRGMREILDRANAEQSGRFLAFDGRELPW